jgi:hypothetical protein
MMTTSAPADAPYSAYTVTAAWPSGLDDGAIRPDGDQADLADATLAVFEELLPQFESLLPTTVILECVEHAVQDLLGSICIDALPEMAARLAAVRLERRL